MKYWRDCVNNKLLKCRILLRCEIFYIETRRKEGIGMNIFFFFSLLETRESYLTHMFDTMFNVSREKRSTCRIEEILCAMLEQGWHSSLFEMRIVFNVLCAKISNNAYHQQRELLLDSFSSFLRTEIENITVMMI